MIIGVTGTRDGMNSIQIEAVGLFLQDNSGEFHHGDCFGVDLQAARIAKHLGYRVICHPPEKDYLRAFHESDEIRPKFNYLRRDRNIVDAVELLIVVPKQNEWQPEGGTWYTYDYATRVSKPTITFFPNGEIKHGKVRS